MTDPAAEPQSIAFERAYLDHFPRVRSFLRVYLGNIAAVDDLTQDTFLQYWSSPQAFDASRAGLRTYLLGIARKKAADWWRRSERHAAVEAEAARKGDGDHFAMREALALLEPDLRNVLWLREAEGYSYQELAQILAIPVGTVRSRLFTAREKLRQIWREK